MPISTLNKIKVLLEIVDIFVFSLYTDNSVTVTDRTDSLSIPRKSI